MNQQLELLGSMPIFSGLEDSTLDLIARLASPVAAEAGEYFFHEGDESHDMYVLSFGEVDICRTWDSRTWTLKTITPGDCFGEMSLIDLLPRSASVVAIKRSEALQITLPIIDEVHRHSPEQYTLLYMNLSREVSRRLRRMDDMVFRTYMEMSAVESLVDTTLGKWDHGHFL